MGKEEEEEAEFSIDTRNGEQEINNMFSTIVLVILQKHV